MIPVLDVSEYTGAITLFAATAESGELLGIEIIETDPKIRVTPGMVLALLQIGRPWTIFDGRLLKISDGAQVVAYRLDGIDTVSGTHYFSLVATAVVS